MHYRQVFGLTPQEAALYELLLSKGQLSARQIAHELGCLPNAVYRLARVLATKQCIVVRKGWPRTFEPVQLPVALQQASFLRSQQQARAYDQLVGPAMAKMSSNRPNVRQTARPTDIEIIAGRQALYDRYIVEAQLAQIEILAFTIGIAYNDALEQVQRDARARGVDVRHVVQKIDSQNYYIVERWRRLGVKLRYYPTQSGFHLMVFDGRTVIMTLSSPDDTEDRTSLIITSPAAAAALRDYFYDIWSKSKLVAF